MASVPDTFINPSWLDFMMNKIGRIPVEWQESIVDQLDSIDSLRRDYAKTEMPFGEDEILELRALNASKQHR